MKIRTFTLVAVAIMLISLFTVTAMAADQTRLKDKLQDGSCGSCLLTTFADTDGDGICDNFVDLNGDEVCDNCHADCDGDGIPDKIRNQKRDGSCQN